MPNREILILNLSKLKGISKDLICFGILKRFKSLNYINYNDDLKSIYSIIIYFNYINDRVQRRDKSCYIYNSDINASSISLDSNDKVISFDARTEVDAYFKRIDYFLTHDIKKSIDKK
jgi:hypothetical protein